MKYKLAGIINLIFGLLQIILSFVLVFSVIPGLKTLSSELAIQSNFLGSYLILGTITLLGATNIFLWVKLFLGREETRQKYFKYALILILLSLLVTGICWGFVVLSLTSRLYNLGAGPNEFEHLLGYIVFV